MKRRIWQIPLGAALILLFGAWPAIAAVRVQCPATILDNVTGQTSRPQRRLQAPDRRRRVHQHGRQDPVARRAVPVHLRLRRRDGPAGGPGHDDRDARGGLLRAHDLRQAGAGPLPDAHQRRDDHAAGPLRSPLGPLPRVPQRRPDLRRRSGCFRHGDPGGELHLLLQERRRRDVSVPLPRRGDRAHADGDARQPLRPAGAGRQRGPSRPGTLRVP